MRAIAISASSTILNVTIPATANPRKITTSDARSSTSSSRLPASDCSPNSRAIPPSIPSSTCPTNISHRPACTRPVATATPAATLKTNDAHVTWAGVARSLRWRNRRIGLTVQSEIRIRTGMRSCTEPARVHDDIEHEQHGEEHSLLDLVGDPGQPPTGHVVRIGIERHLFEPDAVVHRHVDREEDHRHDGAEEVRQRQ